MLVHIGGDHAAWELKNALVAALQADGHEVVDHGAHSYDAQDDYPVFCIPAAEAVAADPASLGVVLGGSGNGEQIAANKVKGIRAALVYDACTAELARLHNNANIISLGGRKHTEAEAIELVRLFLATDYSGEERHTRRIEQLAAYETDGTLPA